MGGRNRGTKRRGLCPGSGLPKGLGGPASLTQRKSFFCHSQLPTLPEQEAAPGPHLPASEGWLHVSSQVFNPVFSVHSSHHLSLCLSVARSQASRQRDCGLGRCHVGGLLPRKRMDGSRCPLLICRLGLTGPPRARLTAQLPPKTEGAAIDPSGLTLPSLPVLLLV